MQWLYPRNRMSQANFVFVSSQGYLMHLYYSLLVEPRYTQDIYTFTRSKLRWIGSGRESESKYYHHDHATVNPWESLSQCTRTCTTTFHHVPPPPLWIFAVLFCRISHTLAPQAFHSLQHREHWNWSGHDYEVERWRWQWKMDPEWRCISYWKWWYSIAMLVYQRVYHQISGMDQWFATDLNWDTSVVGGCNFVLLGHKYI